MGGKWQCNCWPSESSHNARRNGLVWLSSPPAANATSKAGLGIPTVEMDRLVAWQFDIKNFPTKSATIIILMATTKIIIKKQATTRLARVQNFFEERPKLVFGGTLGLGILLGVSITLITIGQGDSALQAQLAVMEQQLEQTQARAQTQVNALAARMGELQAQATRLNALGERLTQMGQLEDGEFDFNETPGLGDGDPLHNPAQDVPLAVLNNDLQLLEQRFATAHSQLSVLESLLFDQQLEQNTVPSRMPIRNSYITSGFGFRRDPFGRGTTFHRGIDFHAKVGDPVLSVADGVVRFSGVKRGYGNVVEIDHGNGYVTLYAHNSRNTVKEGDLVRVGQEVAKAGSTGRSTGAHVHFEVWKDGQLMNPRQFLGQGNTPVGREGRG